jgi:soluble P-type ATPase
LNKSVRKFLFIQPDFYFSSRITSKDNIVEQLIKFDRQSINLSVGDGVNDVDMITTANV